MNEADSMRWRVSKILRDVADRSKLSNAEIARRAGISKSTITEAIRGVYGMRVETLARVIEACGYKLDVVVRLEFPPTSQKVATSAPKA